MGSFFKVGDDYIDWIDHLESNGIKYIDINSVHTFCGRHCGNDRLLDSYNKQTDKEYFHSDVFNSLKELLHLYQRCVNLYTDDNSECAVGLLDLFGKFYKLRSLYDEVAVDKDLLYYLSSKYAIECLMLLNHKTLAWCLINDTLKDYDYIDDYDSDYNKFTKSYKYIQMVLESARELVSNGITSDSNFINKG